MNDFNIEATEYTQPRPTVQFFRGSRSAIDKIEKIEDGRIFFATDTKQIMLDCDFTDSESNNYFKRIIFGGSTGIYYANRTFSEDEVAADLYIFSLLDGHLGEDVTELPDIDDLILNTRDGSFYRVIRRDEENQSVEGTKLTISGSGGGGTGGGTGSGAGYIVAEEARKMGILTVGVVTKPFDIEGEVRRRNAEWAIQHMAHSVDALITIPNERLLQVVDPNIPWKESLRIADDILRQGVQGVTDIITEEHIINIDFADVEAIMKDAGSALMGIGRASGENRASVAAQQAIESPLLEVSIDGARGVLYLVSGGEGVSMAELNEVGQVITSSVNPEANIIMGASVRPELEDEIMVTVIATGFDSDYYSGDAAAQAIINPISEPEPEVNPAMEEPRAQEEPVAQPVVSNPISEPEPVAQPNTAGEDFATQPTTNIWNSGVFGSNDDDNDVPAILRRHKRNRN